MLFAALILLASAALADTSRLPPAAAGTVVVLGMAPGEAAVFDPRAGKWEPLPGFPPLTPVPMVATSSRHIFAWGGAQGQTGDRGLIYDLKARRGIELPKSPLAARAYHELACGDSVFFVWGGMSRKDGAIFDLRSNRWTLIPEGPLGGRYYHGMVAAGRNLVVWGGYDGQTMLSDGALYDPGSGGWQKLPDAPIDGRHGHAMVHHDRKIYIWGGGALGTSLKDGAVYDLVARSWKKMAEGPLPPTYYPGGVWTSRGFFVWGSEQGRPTRAAIYQPSTDSWREVPIQGLQGRWFGSTVCDGSNVILWGGWRGNETDPPGGVYNVQTGGWTLLPPSPVRWTQQNHVATYSR